MTTIAWDGIELVADRRVGWYTQKSGFCGVMTDDAVKILVEPYLVYQGMKILAMAVAGPYDCLQRFGYPSAQTVPYQTPIETQWFYQPAIDLEQPIQIFLILEDRFVLIYTDHREIRQAVYKASDTPFLFVLGDAHASFAKPRYGKQFLTARDAVAWSAIWNKGTGGGLHIWSREHKDKLVEKKFPNPLKTFFRVFLSGFRGRWETKHKQRYSALYPSNN